MLRIFIRNVVLRYGKIARWADLVLGLVTIAAGIHSGIWWLIALGALSLVAFAFNLNGRIQAWSQDKATSYVKRRQSQ